MTTERIAELRELFSKNLGTLSERMDADCQSESCKKAGNECLDEIERLQNGPSRQRLASVLQSHGIVDASAIDDPEWYDNFRTLEAINAAALELRLGI